jgi:hypothetical protein
VNDPSVEVLRVPGGQIMVNCFLLVMLLAVPPGQYDTVVLTSGGILRGTVVEDVPGAAVVLEMPDGTARTIPRAEVAWIDYAQGAPPPAEGEVPPPPGTGPPESDALSLEQVPMLQVGVSTGVAVPVGLLDAAGLGFGSAVSPQITFTFEGSFRPIVELELGVYLLLGAGSTYGPINGYCLAAGGWCDAFDLSVGFFPRWSFLPRGSINPWVMVSGGFEWMSATNAYHDAFDYTGWLVGAAVGLDLRFGPGVSGSFALGTRWGQFTSLSVSGLLPSLPFSPATHGWIDLSFRANYGF